MQKKETKIMLIIRNFSWIFTGKIFYAISNLAISIIITRYLGPNDNGIFNYVLAYTTMFSAIAGMGLEEVMVKEFNTSEMPNGNIICSGFILKLCGGLAAFILSVFGSYLIGMSWDKRMYVGIISISFIFQSFDVIQYWFQSQSHNKSIVICQNIVRVCFIVIKLGLAIFNGDLLGFVVVTALETACLSVSLLVTYRIDKFKTGHWEFNQVIFKKLFSLSWPMILSSIASSVYMKIDQVMIGDYLGNYELGIYSVAVKLAESWYFIPMGIVASVLPILAKIYKESEDKFYDALKIYADAMTLMAYIISLVMMLFAKIAILILFGEEYVSASELLVLYVWSGVFVNFGLIRGTFISINECTKIGMYGTITGAVGNIILNIILIPTMGAKGAVWATIITQMIASFLSSFIFKKTRTLAVIQLHSLFPFVRMVKLFGKYIRRRKNGINNNSSL